MLPLDPDSLLVLVSFASFGLGLGLALFHFMRSGDGTSSYRSPVVDNASAIVGTVGALLMVAGVTTFISTRLL